MMPVDSRDCESTAIAEADRVHYPNDSFRFSGDRLGYLALQVGIDQAAEVHHMIQGLHVD
jgi:hypothetical protein